MLWLVSWSSQQPQLSHQPNLQITVQERCSAHESVAQSRFAFGILVVALIYAPEPPLSQCAHFAFENSFHVSSYPCSLATASVHVPAGQTSPLRQRSQDGIEGLQREFFVPESRSSREPLSACGELVRQRLIPVFCAAS